MPVLQRHQALLAQRQDASPRKSSDSDDTLIEHVVMIGDDYEKPHKEMDFPSAKLVISPQLKMKKDLRINTYSRTELHERYMSSEEEPSPSPDSEKSQDEELRHKPSAKFEQPIDLCNDDSKTEIAVAVPILSPGRPKLVDITNLAPMHRRKQRIPKSQLPHHSSKVLPTRSTTVVDRNTPFPANEAVAVKTSPSPSQSNTTLRLKESQHLLTKPSTWLPEDEALLSEDEGSLPPLDIRRTPSYHDYDPYSLDPPRLTVSQRGSVSRARGSTAPPPTNNHISSWKGLTRSLSLVKRQHSHQQLAKKPKMIARGANEREESVVIPPFPFEEAAPA